MIFPTLVQLQATAIQISLEWAGMQLLASQTWTKRGCLRPRSKAVRRCTSPGNVPRTHAPSVYFPASRLQSFRGRVFGRRLTCVRRYVDGVVLFVVIVIHLTLMWSLNSAYCPCVRDVVRRKAYVQSFDRLIVSTSCWWSCDRSLAHAWCRQ